MAAVYARTQLESLFTVGVTGDLSDESLLRRFLDERGGSDQAAFAALVERHGPMVLRLCLQVLRDPHEAQDAFQATFLVLARRASSVRKAESLASWLHGIALRVGLRARSEAARRRGIERRAAGMKAEHGRDEVGGEPWAELHEEIDRLPAKYREPVVLCYLEGMTAEAAASRIGCPRGTVLSRLSRARDRLRARLVRRGAAPPAAFLTAGWVPEATATLPAILLDSTVRMSVSFVGRRMIGIASIPAAVAALARGASYAMTISKLQILGAAAMTCALALGAVYVVVRQKGRDDMAIARRTGLAAASPAQAGAIGSEMRGLSESKLKIAKRAYEMTKLRIESPPALVQPVLAHNLDRLARWSRRWMEAERELSPSPVEGVRAVRDHLARMERWLELTKGYIMNGAGSGVSQEDVDDLYYEIFETRFILAGASRK